MEDSEILIVLYAKSMFETGQLAVTEGALQAMREVDALPTDFLDRHRAGDWGDLCDEDKKLNDKAVKSGERILSSYTMKNGEPLWIITEADRSSTCILRPEDY